MYITCDCVFRLFCSAQLLLLNDKNETYRRTTDQQVARNKSLPTPGCAPNVGSAYTRKAKNAENHNTRTDALINALFIIY